MMKQAPRGVRLFMMLMTCALLLTGCTPVSSTTAADTDDSQVLLGFSQLGSESAWRIGNTVSIQEAAKRAGVHVTGRIKCHDREKPGTEALTRDGGRKAL